MYNIQIDTKVTGSFKKRNTKKWKVIEMNHLPQFTWETCKFSAILYLKLFTKFPTDGAAK